MESKFVSRGGVTVNLNFITLIERVGAVVIFYGETVWADHEDKPSGWEQDIIAKFRYANSEEAAKAEQIIRGHLMAVEV